MNWKVLFVGLGLTLSIPAWAQKGGKGGELAADVEVIVMLDKEKVEPNQKVGVTLGVALPDGKKALLEMQRDRFMHVYAIASDLSYFEHLAPEIDKDRNFKFEISLPKPGKYQLFADFKVAGLGQRIVPVDIQVSGRRGDTTVPGSEVSNPAQEIDDYEIILSPQDGFQTGKDVELSFQIKKKGKPVRDLDNYMSGLGYAVYSRNGADSAVVMEAHPMSNDGPNVNFTTSFRRTGVHKIWFEFKHDGKVRLVDFAINVERAPKPVQQEVIKSVPAELKH